jgi:hypothetical protein
MDNYNTVPQHETYNKNVYLKPNYYSNVHNPELQAVYQPSSQPVIVFNEVNVVELTDTVYPSVSVGLAIAILFINMFFPGIGTMIIGCFSQAPGYFICIGFLQSILAIILIGWIWALVTSVTVLMYCKR